MFCQHMPCGRCRWVVLFAAYMQSFNSGNGHARTVTRTILACIHLIIPWHTHTHGTGHAWGTLLQSRGSTCMPPDAPRGHSPPHCPQNPAQPPGASGQRRPACDSGQWCVVQTRPTTYRSAKYLQLSDDHTDLLCNNMLLCGLTHLIICRGCGFGCACLCAGGAGEHANEKGYAHCDEKDDGHAGHKRSVVIHCYRF